MRDPDTELFAKWQELMVTGEMTGRNRPVGRITVGKNKIRGHRSNRPGIWRNVLFQQPAQVELGYVQSIRIDRSIDQDAATCTISIYNDHMLHNAYSPQGLDTGIGRPGYRSLDRGLLSPIDNVSTYEVFQTPQRQFPTSWDYPAPGDEPGSGSQTWTHPDTEETFTNFRAYDGGSGNFHGATEDHNRQLLIPNRVIRTFQGYGSDNFDAAGHAIDPGDPGYVSPMDDSQLVQTGVWLIDRVVFSTDGMITIECRDVAKVLLEQYIYPDMIPMSRFPLRYCPIRRWQEEVVVQQQGRPGPNVITGPGAPSGEYVSSNDPWVGTGSSIYGHFVADAFDNNTSTYWLSIGNASGTAAWAYEYITGNARGDKVNQVVVNTVSTGYECFVSIYENGSWKGSNTIPYDPNSAPAFPNDADIPYVAKYTVSRDGDNVFNLPRIYDAQYVRITFHKLWNSGLGTFPYRAAVRTWSARYRPEEIREMRDFDDEGEPGVITDWSEAVREMCGWAGFTWFANTSLYPGVRPDPLLGSTSSGVPLRVWGDFEWLGAGPILCTQPEFFTNKSFMEGINQVVNMIGAVFFIDEAGGAVFRMPNIFSAGNFITGNLGGGITSEMRLTDNPIEHYMRDTWPIEFHENANLIDYQVAVDDSSVRSEVLVVGEPSDVNSESEAVGGYVLGLNPITGQRSAVDFDEVLAGQTRLFLVPGDDTKNFASPEECQRMAELTAIKILFTYRKAQLSAPCHPGLQIDDQVRIFERTTNEYNVHYVSAISSSMDLETGEWTMDVTTHWLGNDPRQTSDWFLDTVQLTPAVRQLPAIEQRLADARND